MIKVVILSGGTGSIALTEGLKKFSDSISITTLLNLYDDGKSTGDCRKVCNVLGPSDFRKRISQLYKLSNENYDRKIIEFFDNRYDLKEGSEKEQCLELCAKWNLDFNKYIEYFFSQDLSHTISYKDFNISNIVISSMFAYDGYEQTILFFQNFLQLTDKIVINSYDNLLLKANTENGIILKDEASIVEYNNSEDKIKDICFEEFNPALDIELSDLTEDCITSLKEANLIIISSGTIWSSLIPTLKYCNLYDLINRSKAHKILVMNNSEDKDTIGVSNLDIIGIYSQYLNIDTFNIFMNEDADVDLQIKDFKSNYKYLFLGNINGKHNPDLLAHACIKSYYNLLQKPELLMIDFDDTLYTRDEKDIQKVTISIENVKLFNAIALKLDCMLTSGNSYNRIYSKLSSIFGSEMNINFRLFADGGLVEYKNNKQIDDKIKDYIIEDSLKEEISLMLSDFISSDKLSYRGPSKNKTMLISIRPLQNDFRKLLTTYFNSIYKDSTIQAKMTGTSTIDIMNVNINKSLLFIMYPEIKEKYSIYIGDEIDKGNDVEIATKCSKYYQVVSVEDTNLFLKILESTL